MEIKLYSEYSTLDKCLCFGIEVINPQGDETYINWFWFHLGEYLHDKNVNKNTFEIMLFPYKVGKIVSTYKFCNDGRRQAKMIAKQIIKIIENGTKQISRREPK